MISQLAFALVSPAVRSVVNVITAPDTDATTRSEPFGVAPQVCPDLSSNRSFCPATIDASVLASVTEFAVASMAVAPEAIAAPEIAAADGSDAHDGDDSPTLLVAVTVKV